MPKLSFDQFPLALRLAGAVLLVGIGMMVRIYLEDYGWVVWIAALLGLILVFTQESLTLNLGRGTWVYKRGVWPLMMTSVGGFEQLYGIEITKARYEDSESAENYVSSYTATLHWRDGSPGAKALYTGGSFSECAWPAVRLANQLKIPILLARDMRAYDIQLGEVQSQVGGNPTL